METTEPSKEFDSVMEKGGGFPTALTTRYGTPNEGDGGTDIARCLDEIDIMLISGAIRDKPRWWEKIYDPEIVETWMREIEEAFGSDGSIEAARSSKFLYALDESLWLSQQLWGPIRHAAVDYVFCRDDMSAELLESLKAGVAQLRAVPAIGSDREDRHPGTPQMVDLVHPSLYAYEQGKTRVLAHVGADCYQAPPWDDFIGASGILERPRQKVSEPRWSESSNARNRWHTYYYDRGGAFASPAGLQWLPSEFFVEKDSGDALKCQINSYINSLHPKEYKTLYENLGDLFVHVLPIFETVLTEVGGGGERMRIRQARIPVDRHDWWNARPLLPREFQTAEYVPSHKRTISLRDRPLQVIVKIASLQLHPGETYEGGVWHVEGTKDERIVATACCYLDSSNVEGGALEFRTEVASPDSEHEEFDYRGAERMFGIHNRMPLVQPRGSCSTHLEGRILAWPNTLQHRVAPVRLVDPTLPGQRTICCFFLVDPTLRIRSTATVPPQQRAWLDKVRAPIVAAQFGVTGVRDKIISMANDQFLSYEQASERRERLMNERRQIFRASDGNGLLINRHFSLCEH